MAFRFLRLLPALLCLTFVLVTTQTPAAETRQWTDKNGQSLLASFVRVSGDKVVLKRGSRIMQFPLSELSQEDRDFIDSQKKSTDTRFWTVNRRKIRGSFRSYKNGLASISAGGRERDYPLRMLSQEDREHIRAVLEKDGKLADLPASDPIKLGSRIASSRGNDAIKHQPRVWTNDKGKEVEATFVRIDGENAILRRGSSGKEIPFPLERLSQADRQHIQDIQTRPQVAAAAPRQAATRPSSSPTRNRIASRPTPSSPNSSAYRGGSQRPTRSTPTMPNYGPSVDASAQSTRMQERMAEQHRRSQAALEAHSNALSSAASRQSRSRGMRSQDYKKCSKCMRTISQDIGAGDSCPHCGVFFEYTVNEDGSREYASLARRRGHQAARAVYSIGTLMIIIGSIIFVKRKVFG